MNSSRLNLLTNLQLCKWFTARLRRAIPESGVRDICNRR
jgi:hypothetical protein